MSVFAKKRTLTEAAAEAESFYSHQLSLRNTSAKAGFSLAYACTDENNVSLRSTATDEAYYYVFNVGDDNGYIIISGDDRTDDVLGYSTDGSFNYETIPENFRNWLWLYRRAVENLPDETPKQSVSGATNNVKRASYATEVKPLLGQNVWGQREPYNNLCPVIPGTDKRAVTGCVATSMAQIMNYYDWPAQGKGFKTYVSGKHNQRQSVDFSKATYDWTKILDVYNEYTGDEEKTAIATLLYHCGVAAGMNYSYESGAGQHVAALGMVEYFDYDPGMQLLERYYYTTDEWLNMLVTELNEARPIFYVGGRENRTAHAFVCDGYDTSGLFHFNWGWYGSGNGYFNVSIIEPSNMFGYNGEQNIIIGIQPNKSITPSNNQFFTLNSNPIEIDKNIFLRNERIAFSLEIYHTRIAPHSGDVALGLYDSKNDLTAILYNNRINRLPKNELYVIHETFSVPAWVSAGDYTLRPVSSGQDGTWEPVRNYTMKSTGLPVIINDYAIAFSRPDEIIPQVVIESIARTNDFYENSSFGSIEAVVSNYSQKEVNTAILFMLQPDNMPYTDYITHLIIPKRNIQIDWKYTFINPGETKTLSLNPEITVPAGRYKLYIIDKDAKICLNTDHPTEITVHPKPMLEMVERMSFYDVNNVFNGDRFTFTIKNVGNDFSGYVLVDVLDKKTMSVVDNGISLPVFVRRYEEQTIETLLTFSGGHIPPGNYILRASYSTVPIRSTVVFDFLSPENSLLDISIINIYSETSNQSSSVAAFSIYPNPAADVLYIRSEAAEDIRSIRIFGLDGSQVMATSPAKAGTVTVAIGHLPTGVYLLRCETNHNVYVEKIFKE